MDHKVIPTVCPATNFNIEKDTDTLHEVLKGLFTDKETLTNVLTVISNDQRQQLKDNYNKKFQHDLIKDLRGALSGDFKHLIVALVTQPIEFLCEQLRNAFKGISMVENVLIETLFSKSSEELAQIVALYQTLYNSSLPEYIRRRTASDFCPLLTLLVDEEGVRADAGTIDEAKADKQAAELYAVCKGKLHSREEVFYRLLVEASFVQLRLVFAKYKELSGYSVQDAIRRGGMKGFTGILLSIVECVQSPPAFFATRLFKAMDGAGTDDTTLIRIIVSRSEIDLGNIKEEFERLYNRTLVSAVKSETSGDYKRALCALIGGA